MNGKSLERKYKYNLIVLKSRWVSRSATSNNSESNCLPRLNLIFISTEVYLKEVALRPDQPNTE